MTTPLTTEHSMRLVLDQQRASFYAEGTASAVVRRERLGRVLAMTLENKDRIVDAIRADYSGIRSRREISVIDLLGNVNAIKHARKNVTRWMRPERRSSNFPFGLFGARSTVVPTPKGVVGIVSPWNAPYSLAINPATSALAAGNRVMIKVSEHAEATSALTRELVAKYFDLQEMAVFTGGPEVGDAFSQLQFDHLFFTGNETIGRKVASVAGANLVPVTLELGGKSPVIVGKTADLKRACEKVVFGKMLNAGQICIAPDYILVPRSLEDAFVEGCVAAAKRLFPNAVSNEDYTPIISGPRKKRLEGLVEDARNTGALVTVVDQVNAQSTLRMPLHILQNVPPDSAAMREEIFGPLMPILPYDRIEDAAAMINGGATPLALYYFGEDADERSFLLSRTRSGGVTFNDTHMHYLQENLPFGGVGASGSGSYHGHDGFLEFSHPRAVFNQTFVKVLAMVGFYPPYGKKFDRYLASQIR